MVIYKYTNIWRRIIAVSGTPIIHEKLAALSQKISLDQASLARSFKDISNNQSIKGSLSSVDMAFIVALTLVHPKSDIKKILNDTFNGYMSPLGKQFLENFLQKPFSSQDLGKINLSPYVMIKNQYAPFRTVMLFDDLKLVVIAKLKNYLPRYDDSIQRKEMLGPLRKDIVNWATEIGFDRERILSLSKGDYINLAWRAMPLVNEYESVLTYGKFLSLLFFHDDDGDNLSAIKARTSEKDELGLGYIRARNNALVDIFQNGAGSVAISDNELKQDPIIKAAIEITQVAHSVKTIPPANFQWLASSMKEYLEKSSEESTIIRERRAITQGYYLERLRPYTSSLYACFALSAILQEISVNIEDITDDKNGCELLKTGNMHVSIANDIISYPKEVAQEAISLVLIYLLQGIRDNDTLALDKDFLDQGDLEFLINNEKHDLISDAVKTAISTLNNYMVVYNQCITTIPDSLKDLEYRVVRPWILGNGDWQDKSSERYRKKLDLPTDIEDCGEHLKNMGYRVIDLSK